MQMSYDTEGLRICHDCCRSIIQGHVFLNLDCRAMISCNCCTPFIHRGSVTSTRRSLFIGVGREDCRP
jgi:hypothetical protein